MPQPLPPELFERIDEADDRLFYAEPRLVTHLDDATIAALREHYAEVLAPGDRVLDLMSSWVSHLPDTPLGRVAGLGMNAEELAANPRLDEWRVQDLNRQPELPWPDASFDAVTLAVSIQYLTRPVEVFRSIARILRPGGRAIVALSHRCFPTKAIRAFHVLDRDGRLRLVSRYFELAGGFEEAVWLDRSPQGADPLWIVRAEREGSRSPRRAAPRP